jgi:hypothetical protein
MKKKGTFKAKELYNSPWFHKVLSIVEKMGDEWHIISAEHGLLDPNQIISDYDTTLLKMRKYEREEWAEKVLQKFLPKVKSGDKVIMLAGKYYREFLEEALIRKGVTIEVPTKHLTTGKQLEWLDQQRKLYS